MVPEKVTKTRLQRLGALNIRLQGRYQRHSSKDIVPKTGFLRKVSKIWFPGKDDQYGSGEYKYAF